MGTENLEDWISDGEKYALIGMAVKVEEAIHFHEARPGFWVTGETTFPLPQHWREWLGTIRAEELTGFNLFLLTKRRSTTPDLIDDDNGSLEQRVGHFYTGLILASPFAPAHAPVMLSGARRNSEIGIRSQHDLHALVPCAFRPYPPILSKEIELAARLAESIGAIGIANINGGHWRFFRTLDLYISARAIADNLERLHQYCRCIEGLILPSAGDTKKQFKSRTELFIGPRHHDMMGEMYDVRSAVEHLHENRYLETFDRDVRLDLLKKEAVAEYIARSTLVRILNDRNLWSHFANTTALAKFWTLPAAERHRIWGESINPIDAIADLDPRLIANGHLGGP
jgi:hypothetical protein